MVFFFTVVPEVAESKLCALLESLRSQAFAENVSKLLITSKNDCLNRTYVLKCNAHTEPSTVLRIVGALNGVEQCELAPDRLGWRVLATAKALPRESCE